MRHIFELVRKEIGDLMSANYSEDGTEVEIILPLTAINSTFVSVFVKKVDNMYIVHDGCWLTNGEYAVDVKTKNSAAQLAITTVCQYYEGYIDRNDGQLLLLKPVTSVELVPDRVFDMGMLILQIVNSCLIHQ